VFEHSGRGTGLNVATVRTDLLSNAVLC